MRNGKKISATRTKQFEIMAKRMKIEQVQYFSPIILNYNFYIILIVSIFYIM